MARRKSRRKPEPKKKLLKLDTKFTCPFCNHANSVECVFKTKLSIAEAICNICQESYCTKLTALTDPIDVYSEWLDECMKANAPVDEC